MAVSMERIPPNRALNGDIVLEALSAHRHRSKNMCKDDGVIRR